MNEKIIKSGTFDKPYNSRIFLLSLVFTGLGQMYRGEFSRGIIFFFLRIISLLLIPLYAVRDYSNTSLLIYTVLVIFHLLLWLAAPVDYLVSSKINRGGLNVYFYNTRVYYIIFSFINISVLTVSLVILSTFFNIKDVDSDIMQPTFEEGECLLVNDYAAEKIKAGDVALYRDGEGIRLGRLIAQGGDEVLFQKGIFSVNRSEPQTGVFNDRELEELGFENLENIYFEINNNRRYPVIYDMKKEEKKDANKNPFIVKKNHLLVAADDRMLEDVYKEIPADSVLGRVEGIIFSSTFKRMLQLPFVDVK